MSNVADLELCKELYEFTKWAETNFHEIVKTDKAWFIFSDMSNISSPYLINGRINRYQAEHKDGSFIPAYDAGYLLRKLPNNLREPGCDHGILTLNIQMNMWVAGYVEDDRISFDSVRDTPEDALCSLAIKLANRDLL